MSLYVDFRIASKSPDAQTQRMQWCKVDQILAVATDDNAINFYQEEGDRVADAEVKRNCPASALDWRPTQKVLASGWDDGTLSLWNVKDKSEKADRSVHSHPIDVLQWSPEGGRLVAGDRHGLVSVWRTDHRSRLSMVSKFQLISEEGYVEPVTACQWIITPEYRDAQTDLPTPPQHFIVGTESGTVSVMDLKGQQEAKVHETSEIVALHWYEERQRVVVITKACAMAVYSVETSSNGSGSATVSLVSRVKLSMSATAVREGISSASWIAPGLLVTCGLENVVRFWDIEHDENYSVSLSSLQEGDAVPRRECATVIAYNVRTKILAVGTDAGKCLLWRFVGDSGMPRSASVPSIDSANDNNKGGELQVGRGNASCIAV
jgi:intraflagellar transport protein 140